VSDVGSDPSPPGDALSDWSWMQDHWDDKVWMHANRPGTVWTHSGGMMSGSGPMMGQ